MSCSQPLLWIQSFVKAAIQQRRDKKAFFCEGMDGGRFLECSEVEEDNINIYISNYIYLYLIIYISNYIYVYIFFACRLLQICWNGEGKIDARFVLVSTFDQLVGLMMLLNQQKSRQAFRSYKTGPHFEDWALKLEHQRLFWARIC